MLIEQHAEHECWGTIRQGWDALVVCLRPDTPAALAEQNSEQGFGVTVSGCRKACRIDCKRVPQLDGADLE